MPNNTNDTEAQGSPEGVVVVVSILGVCLILEIAFGNLLVIIAVVRDRTLHIIQNWFIVSLAVADLFLAIFVIPLSLTNELLGYWYFGRVLCELWLHIDVLLCTASILNLCVISIDRYWLVTAPTTYTVNIREKRAKVMIALAWIMSLLVCIPSLTWWRTEKNFDVARPACLLSSAVEFVVYSSLGSFFIPLFCICFLYVRIYLVARQTARKSLNRMRKLKQHQEPSTVTQSYQNPVIMEEPEETPRNNLPMTSLAVMKDDGVHMKLLTSDADSIDGNCIHQSASSTSMPLSAAIASGSVAVGAIQTDSTDADDDLGKSPLFIRKKAEGMRRKSRLFYTEFVKRMKNRASTAEPVQESAEAKRKRALKARERRATLVIGIVMVCFIGCWMPFFTIYLIDTIMKDSGHAGMSMSLFTAFFWLGYCNSAANPIIYTVFNRDFKTAFKKILCGETS